MVSLDKNKINFVKFTRVSRLATFSGKGIHLVPLCHVFDGKDFFMGTNAKTKKLKHLAKNNRVTLLVDEYSEDWTRQKAVMVEGEAEIIEHGPMFNKGKKLLEEKFPQYRTLFPLKEGESVIIRVKSKKYLPWDYAKGEFREPH